MEKLLKYNGIVDALLLGITIFALISDIGVPFQFFGLVFIVGGGMLRVYKGRQMPLIGVGHHVVVFFAAIVGRAGYSFPLSPMCTQFYILMGLIYLLGEPLFLIKGLLWVVLTFGIIAFCRTLESQGIMDRALGMPLYVPMLCLRLYIWIWELGMSWWEDRRGEN